MRRIAMFLMVLGLAAVAAPGGVVWEDNFDSYTTWPDGGWLRGNNGDLSMGFDHTTGTANCLMITKEPGVNEIWAYHEFDSQAKGTVTGWVNQTCESTPGSNGGIRLTIGDGVNEKDIGYICLTEDKYVMLNTPSSSHPEKVLGMYDADTWYQFSLSWDASTHEVTASFNGGDAVTAPYLQAGENATQFWAYNCNNVSTTFSTYVDDLVLTPEPATMVLLAAGGFLTLLRRRR